MVNTAGLNVGVLERGGGVSFGFVAKEREQQKSFFLPKLATGLVSELKTLFMCTKEISSLNQLQRYKLIAAIIFFFRFTAAVKMQNKLSCSSKYEFVNFDRIVFLKVDTVSSGLFLYYIILQLIYTLPAWPY